MEAKAHAEKRLFISLLTRDISLVDAFCDLLDNSINAAVKSSGFGGDSAADYVALLNSDAKPSFGIKVNFDADGVSITDNCGGISATDAREKVFIFGAADPDTHDQDRLSVYGIGLKRAMFKLGCKISMVSDHPEGGFQMQLDVPKWEASHEQPWAFDIEPREGKEAGHTSISVSGVYPDVGSRLVDPAFETALVDRIARAYTFFLAKIVQVQVNGQQVTPSEALVSSNRASESLEIDDVSVSISAGLGVPSNGRYAAETAGWTVFCNGRAVIFFDKSQLTGWGLDGYLPSFQPKHRPFIGLVFFTSQVAENLPWTTTKLGVNTDNLVWQRTLKRMADVGRQVIRFLDTRYTDEGTTISVEELDDAIGRKDKVTISMSSAPAKFVQPKATAPKVTSIQYKVDRKRLSDVKEAIGRRSMSNSEVGKYTFDYFIDNEVTDE